MSAKGVKPGQPGSVPAHGCTCGRKRVVRARRNSDSLGLLLGYRGCLAAASLVVSLVRTVPEYPALCPSPFFIPRNIHPSNFTLYLESNFCKHFSSPSSPACSPVLLFSSCFPRDCLRVSIGKRETRRCRRW